MIYLLDSSEGGSTSEDRNSLQILYSTKRKKGTELLFTNKQQQGTGYCIRTLQILCRNAAIIWNKQFPAVGIMSPTSTSAIEAESVDIYIKSPVYRPARETEPVSIRVQGNLLTSFSKAPIDSTDGQMIVRLERDRASALSCKRIDINITDNIISVCSSDKGNDSIYNRYNNPFLGSALLSDNLLWEFEGKSLLGAALLEDKSQGGVAEDSFFLESSLES
jgi:hypothetical protein